MAISLKKLDEQVIVVTGASSGIGLATARTAASRGARVVLAARSEETLREIVHQISAAGGEALAVTCDVAEPDQVRNVAEAAIRRFGRIDTWVNNAAQGMYGRLDETPIEEARRLFDINFWGVVSGCMTALPHLRTHGGALINVGSEVSDAYVPLLGMYVASKHAVKGYTDSLRVEIEDVDKAPVAITLIQPTAVDTPFPQHARNLMDREPRLPTPRIATQDVADAILEAAVTPTREKRVGGMAVVNTIVSKTMPALADTMSAKKTDQLRYDEPPRHPEGTLRSSSESIGTAGQTEGSGGREAK